MARRSFVAGRAELIDHGFSLSRIKSWLRSGRLVQVFHGVYSYGRDIETREAAWHAALAAAGPGSVLAARSTCEARGVIRPRSPLPNLIEVAVESGNATIHRGLSPAMRRTRVKVVRRRFEDGEVRIRDGLRLESGPRALIDLAVDASEVDVKFAFLEACRLGLFNRPDVDYCFRRIVGRRGARKLRPLLALWVPELRRTRSPLEGLFLLEWLSRDSRMPRVNEKVLGYEVDCYWPDAGLVVELDGGAFHSDPVSRRQDKMKSRKLEAGGLRVLRLPYRLVEDHPAAAVRQVTRALDAG
jgi:very-short-patch-repair endonuclease